MSYCSYSQEIKQQNANHFSYAKAALQILSINACGSFSFRTAHNINHSSNYSHHEQQKENIIKPREEITQNAPRASPHKYGDTTFIILLVAQNKACSMQAATGPNAFYLPPGSGYTLSTLSLSLPLTHACTHARAHTHTHTHTHTEADIHTCAPLPLHMHRVNTHTHIQR